MRPTQSSDTPFPTLTPERRLALVAEVLARGVRRHLAISAQAAALSAGRSSENPEKPIPSGLASGPEKSALCTRVNASECPRPCNQ
jgi:hypothetical protein